MQVLPNVEEPGPIMHALNVAQTFLKGTSPHAPIYVVFQDRGDKKWRFHEEMSGHITATSGQHFASRWNAKRAAYVHAKRVGGSVRIEE